MTHPSIRFACSTLIAASALCVSACGAQAVTPVGGDAIVSFESGLPDVIPPDVEAIDVIVTEVTPLPDVQDVVVRPDVPPPPDGFMVGPHLPFPQIPNHGGPMLPHPEVVVVTFASYSYAPDVEGYMSWLVTSPWLPLVGAEYGVGTASVVGTARLAQSAPSSLTSTDLENMLQMDIAAGVIPTPPDGLSNALYVVYLPSGTSLEMQIAGQPPGTSCVDWDGYHSEIDAPTGTFSYAVVADCGAAGGLSDIEEIEYASSHEFIEAATDAQPINAPAYQMTYDPSVIPSPWLFLGGEVADFCITNSVRYPPSYVATRVWSNTAAAAGSDPCVPPSGLPYFNVWPHISDTTAVNAGQRISFTLTGWSTAPVPSWNVYALSTGTLNVNPLVSPMTINNLTTVTLEFTVPSTAQSGDYAAITLFSTRGTGTSGNLWPVAFYIN